MRRDLLRLLCVLVGMIFMVGSAAAQSWNQMAALRASDGAASDNLGYSVSLSGDRALVGAPLDDDGADSGSAYVFEWDGSAWVQVAKLTASDGAANDRFGWSVSLDGNRALVGAITDDDNGTDSGSAYVFEWDGSAWGQVAKLTASDGAASDFFGYSVSISGDRALVGASGEGSVYVFEWDDSSWAQAAELTDFDGASGDWFGGSVSLDGDRVLVGAYRNDDNGTDSGAAYVFERTSGEAIYTISGAIMAPGGGGFEGVTLTLNGIVTATTSTDATGSYTFSGLADGTYTITPSRAGYVFDPPSREVTIYGGNVSGQDFTAVPKLNAGGSYDQFGGSVSLDGDRALIGAYWDGSAYVFEWDGSSWVEVAKLTASDGALGDWFGYSVSLSGDRALVGAPLDDDNGSASGSAYVFEWDGSAWVEVAKLTASDGTEGDYFGYSVSLSGDRAFVGAYKDDDNGTDSGSAYVFEWDGIGWAQMAKLTASEGRVRGDFGYSVSLSGDRALVGASGSAYIFEWDGIGWGEVVKLSDISAGFGSSVSLDGNRAIVGAPLDDDNGTDSGSAYVYEWDGSAWVQVARLTALDGTEEDYFGYSVLLDGNRAIVGAPLDDNNGTDSGSAYVYEWDGIGWVQVAKFTAPDGAAYDKFGVSVSLSGDRALVGAFEDDDNGTDSGSAYVFEITRRFGKGNHAISGRITDKDGIGLAGVIVRLSGASSATTSTDAAGSYTFTGLADGTYLITPSRAGYTFGPREVIISGGNVTRQDFIGIRMLRLDVSTKLTASDGAASDYFGLSVSLSGNRALVGASWDDDNGSSSGSAYVFKWDGSAWVEVAKLTASDGAAGDRFGSSVSLDGDRAIVAASGDDNKGSAYVFEWDGSAWVEVAKLTASDGAAGDLFGSSVSLDGNRALVGDSYADNEKGAAYVFEWDGSSWMEVAKLTASNWSQYFGESVSLDGDRALVGYSADTENGEFSGSAYVFEWDGSAWVEVAKLTASDGAEYDYFGLSVSLSGDRALVGASRDDDKGSAYVFEWDGSAWVEVAKLTASDGAEYDYFGLPVSLSGDRALVGASGDDDKGSAYVFEWNGSAWVEVAKLTASDGAAGDRFGSSVSLDGNRALVGAYTDDDNGTDSGSAYVFEPDGQCTSVDTGQLPLWNGTIVTNGDGTGSIPLSVPLGVKRIVLASYTNLVLDDVQQGDASLVESGQFECTSTISEGCLAYEWGGDEVDAPTAVDLSIAAPDTAASSFYVYVTDYCNYTMQVNAALDLYQSAVAVSTETREVPGDYALWPNYPNPFNPQTRITFELPVASNVRLMVYDVLGREVARLAAGSYPAGIHAVTWDGRNAAGAPVPSGVYFYRLEAGRFTQTRKMLLLK